MQSLNVLLQQVAQRCQPSEADYALRQRAIQAIEGVLGNGGIRGIVQTAGSPAVQPYGSFISGFYGPGSDLDLAINGYVNSRTLSRRTLDVLFQGMPIEEWVPLHKLDKHAKAAQLITVANLLLQRGVANNMQRILHARVPLLKFVERSTGVECDLCMGNDGASFKAAFVRQLDEFDPRFGQLFRMVKLWAKAHGLNDSSNGTFNSWCLTLMVVFHLQTVSPAVLPPLYYFFQDQAPQLLATRLLQGDLNLAAAGESMRVCRLRQPSIQENFRQAHAAAGASAAAAHSAVELFGGFLNAMAGHLQAVTSSGVPSTRRMSTWLGKWVENAPFKSQYVMLVEDPFDCTDNPGRTLGIWDKIVATVHYTQSVFAVSAQVLVSVRTPHACPAALGWLFGPELLLLISRPLKEAPCLQDELRDLFDAACIQCVRRGLRGHEPRIDVFRELLQILNCPHDPVLCYEDFRVAAAQVKASRAAASRANRRQQAGGGDFGYIGQTLGTAIATEDMETDLQEEGEGWQEASESDAVAGMAAAALVVGEASAQVAEAQRLALEVKRKRRLEKRLAKVAAYRQQREQELAQPAQPQSSQPQVQQQHQQQQPSIGQQQQRQLLQPSHEHQQQSRAPLVMSDLAPKKPKRSNKQKASAAVFATAAPGVGGAFAGAGASSVEPGMSALRIAQQHTAREDTAREHTAREHTAREHTAREHTAREDGSQAAGAVSTAEAAVGGSRKPHKSRKLSKADRQQQQQQQHTSFGEVPVAHHQRQTPSDAAFVPPPPPPPPRRQQHQEHMQSPPPAPHPRQQHQHTSGVEHTANNASTSGRRGENHHAADCAGGSGGSGFAAASGGRGCHADEDAAGAIARNGIGPSRAERRLASRERKHAAHANGGEADGTHHAGDAAGGTAASLGQQMHGVVDQGAYTEEAAPAQRGGSLSGRRARKMQPGPSRNERRAQQQQQQQQEQPGQD